RNGEHGTEDLLPPDAGIPRDVREDRRLDEVAGVEAGGAFTTADEARFPLSGFDVAQDLVVLLTADQRAELHVLREPAPDLDLACFLPQALDEAAGNALLGDEARGGAADLALVPEDAEHDPFDDLLQVGVVEDDDG